ncbi:MAG: Rpn family recombination-promoting nuclease/putative transposase [Lachnospiraceae bacterium]|nr:Rpn family recombination-promoting nuclease/putative transposase [Lachnospiraceae bacterium]
MLDLALLVNDSLYLNLEMQMYRDAFWTERSLSYVCRGFGNLNRGEEYDRVFPAVHTGFLDYDLFPEHPEFVSTFLLTNTKNGRIFSDRLRISVVYLNRIELATEEDKIYGLDLWARAFRAATWEELEMLSKQNEYLQKTVVTIRKLTAEERIRQHCQAREDFEYWERMRALELQRSKEALAESQRSLREKDAQLAAALARIAELETEKARQ